MLRRPVNTWLCCRFSRLGDKLDQIKQKRKERDENDELKYLERLNAERLRVNAEKYRLVVNENRQKFSAQAKERSSQIKEKTSAARERGKESVKIHTDKVKVKTAAKKEQYKEKKEELRQKTREKTEELKEKTEKVRERARVENWYTVPNAMSAVRLGISPYIYHLIMTGNYEYAFYLNIASGISDFLDGQIARKWPSQQSSLGSALDPLADKATMFFIYLAFYYTEHIPPWLFWTFIGRDVLLITAASFMRYRTLAEPKTVERYFDFSLVSIKLHPTWISKSNTLLQFILSYWLMAQSSNYLVEYDYATYPFMCLTAGTTFISFIEYFILKRDLLTWKKVYTKL